MIYKVGDLVQIAGYMRSGTPYPFDNDEVLPENREDIIWIDTVIDSFWDGGGIRVKFDNVNIPLRKWVITDKFISEFVRPRPCAAGLTIEALMATSCIECKTSFMYPVEYNVLHGRLCFCCKDTYGWKYE